MIKLRCIVERITYQNTENGYSVMRVKVKGYDDLVTLVGNLLEESAGSVPLCEGDWKVDNKYGNQFVAESWEEVMPATIYGIEKYLGNGLVKGIGQKFAQLIVSRFRLETMDVKKQILNDFMKCLASVKKEWRKLPIVGKGRKTSRT